MTTLSFSTFACVIFWTLIVFSSIAWYAFLLFYVGAKAGREIRAMTNSLKKRTDRDGQT